MKTGSSPRPAAVYTAAFVLPLLMFTAMLACKGLLPFGSMCILDMDAPGQYIKIFSSIKDIFSGNTDIFYTFSKTLGGDMVSLLAYYMLSPLNLILPLFPKSLFPLAMTLIIGLKLGLCGLSAAIFMFNTGCRRPAVPAFSTAYAFMAYNIIYLGNLIWLDGVYLLPLVALGLVRLLQNKSPLLYILSLAGALFTNYYIGYMLCVFSVAVFACGMFIRLLEKEPGFFRTVGRFALSSLLAGALAAVVLLPCFISLSGTKAGVDGGRLGMFLMYPFEHIACMLYPRAFQTEDMLTGLPFLYCGTVTLSCALLWFLNPRIPLRRRLVSAAFVLALLVSFNVNGLYVIWHGMSYPSGFPYRNAFILSFVLLHFAWQGFSEKEGLGGRRYAAAALICAAGLVLSRPLSCGFLDFSALILGAAGCFAALGLLYLDGRRIGGRAAVLALCLIQLFLLFDNALFLRGRLAAYFDSADYAGELIPLEESLALLEEHDDGFYRIANTAGEVNEPIQAGYNGLSHFSSTEKTEVKRFVSSLGFSSYSGYWVWYQDGGTAAADVLLDVKYILSPHDSHKDYPALLSTESFNIFENPNALGIGFGADAAALGSLDGEEDIFLRQNRIFSALVGEDMQIFHPAADVRTDLENFTLSTASGYPVYIKEAPDRPSSLCYSFTAESDDTVYIYSSAAGEVEAELIVNGESRGRYLGIYDHRVRPLGSFEPGSRVEIRLECDYDLPLENSWIYYEDGAALSDCCERLRARADSEGLEMKSSSRLSWEGEILAGDSLLFLSIPYEKGWRVEVDGEKAELLPALDVLSAVKLDAGHHVVSLRYTPPGAAAGLSISLAAATAVFMLLLRERRRAK